MASQQPATDGNPCRFTAMNAGRLPPLRINSLALMAAGLGLGGCNLERRSSENRNGMEVVKATSIPTFSFPTSPPSPSVGSVRTQISSFPNQQTPTPAPDPLFDQIDTLLGNLEAELNAADTLQDVPELR
jgi:hypothetical protein